MNHAEAAQRIPFSNTLGSQLEPWLKLGRCTWGYRVDRAFGLTDTTIDALIGMDDEHVLALVEAVDRADLHTIHGLAFDTVLGDDVGHDALLAPGSDYGGTSET
jgi:hypothetical protein